MTARRDWRLPALLATAAGIAVLGAVVSRLPGSSAEIAAQSPMTSPAAPRRAQPSDPQAAELDVRFQQALVMLHAKRFDYAVVALERVLELAPRLPEAWTNLGFALLGRRDFHSSRRAFEQAIEIRARQPNAYYGLAEALEGLGDLRGALGAMRSFAHLAAADDPFRRKAEAAIWEWESALHARP